MDRPRSEGLLDSQTAHDASVAVIGAGAIGSNVAYLLAKMGIGTIYITDPDQVAPENLEPQMYYLDDVGYDKATAIVYNIAEFVDDVLCHFQVERWGTNTEPPCRIIVSGVDSIESRLDIAESLLKYHDLWDHYLDVRMGGNVVEMHHVTKDNLIEYVEDELPAIVPMNIPCSMRSVAYNGMFAASLAARAVAAILTDAPVPRHLKYDLLAWGQEVQYPSLQG